MQINCPAALSQDETRRVVYSMAMAFRPEQFGKVALVTGASSGIGAAFARALAARGMDVVLVARRHERLLEIAEELRELGVQAHPIVADLSLADSGEQLEEQLAAEGIEVDLLINNAGFGHYGNFVEADNHPQVTMVDVNCRAVVDLAHRFGQGMKARGRGGIIILSSVLGEMPAANLNVYAATKAFDLYFGLALYHELKPHGVAVLAVQPGATTTEFGEVAGFYVDRSNPIKRTARNVVDTSLSALGRKPAVIDGFGNKAVVQLMRWLPRRLAVLLTSTVIARHHGNQ